MSLLRLALSRPLTIMVAVATVVILAILGISRMKIDIFPQLDLPRITVIQPYGGMDPAQMEGYIVTYYEQHFFYISGVDHVSSRSIQSAAVMDVYFQPGADMADAMAQVVAQVERSRAYMPAGTVTPFIQRFDVGNVPVGFLVFSSETKNVGTIQDLVYSRVRPVVSTIPGVSSPPPFGGNQRSVVVSVAQDKLSQYHMSVDDVVKAIDQGNTVMPSGIVRTGDLQRMTQINSVVSNVQDLGNISLKRNDTGGSVFLRDIAKIEDGTDITTGYALVNGRRTVYMAISKQASASTLAVVDGVKHNIERMQSLLPPDIKVSFEFDQSVYVTQAIEGLLVEGLLGAFLTGLTVLIFLKDVRASLIVILSIPSSLLAAMLGLWACGQTINIMTLSGMALAVGILVDEGTVVIENIHSHIDHGEFLVPAIYRASLEVLVPRLLALLSVISVFMPSFFMTGITRSLFVPMSLAVGLAMLASYLLSGTMVPILAAWMMRSHAQNLPNTQIKDTKHKPDFVDRIKARYQRALIRLVQNKVPVIAIFIICGLSSIAIYPVLGQEIFPSGNPSGFQLRLKAPTGTRFEVTEKIARDVLQMIKQEAGPQNVKVTIGYAGSQPPAYAVSVIYIWTSGPHEAVLLVSLDEHAHINMHRFQDTIRQKIRQKYPDLGITFEAGDIVNKILNFGSATPIQVDVTGPDFANDKAYARRLKQNMQKLPQLVDVTISQPLEYPTLNIQVDRVRAAELGVSTREIGRAMVASTYSSRFTTPVFWRDPKNGLAYQVQVQIPQGDFDDLASVGSIPVKTGSYQGPFLRDVARLYYDQVPGEYDHYNMARQISITANLSTSANNDLGRARDAVQKAINDAGQIPRGVKVTMAGQVPIMQDTFFSLFMGVLFSIVSIYLLLLAFFQSFKLSAIIVSVMPAILFGSLTALLLTGTTINVQSFMGSIMATGVGVANSILVIVFAEEKRLSGMSARAAAVLGASARLRPVMMTSLAMIVGMIPMALGMSEGGDRTAALGRAVIGGLIASTTSVLFILPIIYGLVQKRTSRRGASLLQDFPKLIQETPV